jgi:hypothetical protein
MKNENLEQKVGLMDKFRGFARKTVGAYALTLALGGMYGCEDENGDGGSSSGSSGCSHNVGGKGGYAESGCSSGYHCEDKEVSNKSETSTHTVSSCVSDTPPDNSGGHDY